MRRGEVRVERCFVGVNFIEKYLLLVIRIGCNIETVTPGLKRKRLASLLAQSRLEFLEIFRFHHKAYGDDKHARSPGTLGDRPQKEIGAAKIS